MQTPYRQRQLDRASASARPRTDRRWMAVPIAFLLGAALAVSVLVAVDDRGGGSARRGLVASAATPSRSQPAQVVQLLADEAREEQAKRLQRLRAESELIAAHAAARHNRALRLQARGERASAVQASGGTEAPAHASRPRSGSAQRGSTTRRASTHERTRGARNGSAGGERKQTAQRRRQETAERRQQHAREQEERAAARRNARHPPSHEAGTP